MTNEQFDFLTHALRMTSPSIVDAARLVLIDGKTQADAARQAGCLPNNLARAAQKITEMHSKIQKLYKNT